MFCHRLFLLIILAVSACHSQQQKPQFVRDDSGELLVSTYRTWHVSLSNKLAFVENFRGKTFSVELTGGSCSSKSILLLFKCPGSSEFAQAYATRQTVTHCDSSLPFTMRRRVASGFIPEFDLEFAPSKLPYHRIFRDKLELKVQVHCEEATLESGSLFVYEIQPLLNINSNQQSGIIGVPISRRILTERGVRFLSKLDSTDEYGSVDFIDESVVRVVNEAPDFVKSKFFAGGAIGTDGRCTNYVILNDFPAFVNSASLKSFNLNLHRHMFLNISNGKLHFAIRPVSDIIVDKVSSSDVMSLCVTLGIAGDNFPLTETAFVTKSFTKDERVLSYTRVSGKESPTCHLPDGVTRKSMTVYSGLDTTLLVCPIICSSTSEPFEFTKNGLLLTPPVNSEWHKIHGVEIHRFIKSSKVVKLPSILNSSHSGEYVCSAGRQNFTFDVRVVALPIFRSQGHLPNTIYAMEGEQLTYNCTTAFTNIQSVTVTPKFETNKVSGGRWQKMDIDEFNAFLRGEYVTSSVSSKSESKTLTLSVSRVPAQSAITNFTHRFSCEVNVSSADSAKLGMPSYSAESGADVIFLKRPTLSDFRRVSSCSAASACTPETGAEFSVTLSEEMTQQLNSEGVQVTAYFKFNEFLLSDVLTLKDPEVAATKFDNETNRLTFKLNPITKQEVLDAVKSAKLTPVFNFRFRDGSSAQNLDMRKSRHGDANAAFGNMDCLADERCFYSTEFDIRDRLRSLEFELEFFDGVEL